MLPPSLMVSLKSKYQKDYNYVVIKRFCFLSSVEMLIVRTELITTLIQVSLLFFLTVLKLILGGPMSDDHAPIIFYLELYNSKWTDMRRSFLKF